MKFLPRLILPLLALTTLTLSSTAEAQFIVTPNKRPDMRERMEAEARARAAAESDARARAAARTADQLRQDTIVREIQSLQNTSSLLEQSFGKHLRMRRHSISTEEAELARALKDLTADINHLADDIYGRCPKCERGDYAHVYRSFHLMEYAAEDAHTLAAEAGYARSLDDYFKDIDLHMDQLATTGLRNPRLQRAKMQEHFHGRSWSKNEQHIVMPAVPTYPVAPPVPRPNNDSRRDDKSSHDSKTIDLGDLFGRIFGKK